MDEPIVRAATSPSRAMTVTRRVFRPIWLLAGVAAVLEVPGRRTGAPHRITLIPWDVDGTRYLLSQYGVSNWVLNLRAAGEGQLRHRGRTAPYRAVEVHGDERDRVIEAFRAKTPKPFRRDYDQLPAAVDHPTFRLEAT